MCRSDDALYRSTVLLAVLKADQHSHNEKYVNWNEAAIRELLTIRAEAEIILQFSEMVSAHYTHRMKGHVSLRVVCECTQIPENHWQCECSKSDDPGTNAGTHYPCIFRNLCVKGAQLNSAACMNPLDKKTGFIQWVKTVSLLYTLVGIYIEILPRAMF